MTRDNIIFTICGLLLGLVIGSLIIGPRVAQSKLAGATTSTLAPDAPLSATGSEAAMAPAAQAGGGAMGSVLKQLQTLKAAVEKNPRDFDALAQLGNLYMDAAKFTQAIDYYEKALAVREEASVRTDLGACYQKTGQLDKSLESIRKVIAESPGQFPARFNEVVLLADMKRFDEAKARLAELKKLRPDDADVKRLDDALAKVK